MYLILGGWQAHGISEDEVINKIMLEPMPKKVRHHYSHIPHCSHAPTLFILRHM